MPAPVLVVGFNRPEHLRLTLGHLSRCETFADREVRIAMDGARGPDDEPTVVAARDVAHRFAAQHANVRVQTREANRRFANLVDGATAACEEAGSVIIVEDDVLVSPDFLRFMDRGLERYKDDHRVWAVSGNVVPRLERPVGDGCFFLPYSSTSGWATWARAWRHFDFRPPGLPGLLQDPVRLRDFVVHPGSFFRETLERVVNDPTFAWDPQWHFVMHQAGALSVYPPRSLTWNCGMGAGTNFAFGAGPDQKAVLRSVQDTQGPGVVATPRVPEDIEMREAALDPADLHLLRSHFRRLRMEVGVRYALAHPRKFLARSWSHLRRTRPRRAF